MSKEIPVHHDYFGRELAVDDFVVFSTKNLFQVGRIVKITPQQVRVMGYDYNRISYSTGKAKGTVKYGHEVLKVEPHDVTMYLLRKPNNANGN
jgi:hypothetical protein